MCAEALSKVLSDKSAHIVDCAAGTGRVGQQVCQMSTSMSLQSSINISVLYLVLVFSFV